MESVAPGGTRIPFRSLARLASRQRISGIVMDINPQMLSPLVALVAGILILLMPRLLNYIVAIYLIIIGIAGLMGRF